MVSDEGEHEEDEEETPSEGEDLLTLVLKYGKLHQSEASRKLQVEPDVVNSWAGSLEEGGWIKPRDMDIGDPLLELSKASLKRVHGIKEEMLKEEKKEVKKKKQIKLPLIRVKLDKILINDILIIVSSLLALYLFSKFIRDPNKETLSFFVSVILFSTVSLIFSSYEEFSKTKKALSKLKILAKTLYRVGSRRRTGLLAVAVFIFMIFAVGRFIFLRNIIYLYLAVLSLSSIILIYQPRPGIKPKIMFYTGMTLLTCSTLLLLGVASITKPIIGRRIGAVDIVVAIVLLIILQRKEAEFGVGAKSFKEMIKKTDKLFK